MRTLEIWLHSYTKKGEAREQGSHLSLDGVRLARQIGNGLGSFDVVAVSSIPRTLETSLAMGYAVDRIVDALGPSDTTLYQEIGHHDRWTWREPFVEFARLIDQGGATKQLALLQLKTWQSILRTLPNQGRALIISHGRVIKCGAVVCTPDSEFGSWGKPFGHCEGVELTETDEGDLTIKLLRVDHDEAH